MERKTLKIGIMSKESYRRRTMDIALGEYEPGNGEPRIWFESIQSLAQVLRSENQELLRLIIETRPGSIKELEKLTGRSSSNLSRTLRTMERYGIVELVRGVKTVRPVAKATDFEVRFGVYSDDVEELVGTMAVEAGISRLSAEKALKAFTEGVTAVLKKGGKVTLLKFGSFEVSEQAIRKGHHPQNGAEGETRTRRTLRFRPGASLRKAVNE